MGLFDSMLGGVLGNVLGQAGSAGGLGSLLNSPLAGALLQSLPGKLDAALANTSYGSLDGLLAQLQQAGLAEQAQSWLSNGPNLPVSTDQVVSALGESQIGQLATGLGLPPETLSNLISQYLPGLVDRLSPNGVLDLSKS